MKWRDDHFNIQSDHLTRILKECSTQVNKFIYGSLIIVFLASGTFIGDAQVADSNDSESSAIPSDIRRADEEGGESREPSGDPAWHEERKKIKEQIEEEAWEQAKNEITKKKVTEKLGFDWPVEKPSKSKKEIKKHVEKIVQKRVNEKYPMSKVEEFKI